MDITTLKLDLVQQLVNSNDVKMLTSVKRLIELIRSRSSDGPDEREEELLALAGIFGTNAYGDDEPDISTVELKEPNPNYGK